MKIAIDFDGVLCKRRGIPTRPVFIHDEPMEGALDSVNYFISLGHEVWVFTSNPEPREVKAWLVKNEFPNLEVTNIKKPATIYVDDRAIRFTNWQDIRKYIG